MIKRHLNLCLIAMAVFLSGYVGYRFYATRVETALSTSIVKQVQFEPKNLITAADRAFLRQAEIVNQRSREITKRFPSLKLPAWVYTPENWNNSRVSPVKVIFQQVDMVAFEAVEMPDDNMYRARALKEKVLPELGVVGGQEGVYIRNPPVPEAPPDIHHHFPPRHMDPDSPDPPSKSYPLIATMIIDRDGTTLMRLEDWIELVGGVGHAQALLQEAGWQDTLPIETHLHHSAFIPETSPTNRHIPE